jgi:16S rRNA (guanine527-N7)-methyltransferase
LRAPLTEDAFAAETGVSRETLQRLERHLALLARWQDRLNLVGDSTLADPWRRHVLDSAQLAPLIPVAARTLVDLGSGAGFPGLVLGALRPGLDVHLVESNARKCAFLREAAREMGLVVTVHERRIEAMTPIAADVVTARALAPLPRLIALAAPFLKPNGTCLFLKGKGVEAELTESTKRWKMRVERIASRSDDAGTVLRLWDIVREPTG